jgi:hypothetical protein
LLSDWLDWGFPITIKKIRAFAVFGNVFVKGMEWTDEKQRVS